MDKKKNSKTENNILYILLGILFLIIYLTNSFAITDTNLIAYYKFETGGATLTDEVGANNNGTNTNINLDANGKILNGYYYNGTSSKTVLTNTGFPTDVFTIAMWFKTDSANNMTLYSQGTRASNGFNLELENTDPSHGLSLLVGNAVGRIYSGIVPDNNNWHLVIADSNGAGISLLYDNNNYFSTSKAQVLSITSPTFGFYSADYFDGSMDEVSIWNRVLSVSDRNDLWNNGVGKAYPFNAGNINADFNISFDINSNVLNLINNSNIDVNYSIIDYNWIVNGSTNNIYNPDANQTTYTPVVQNLDYNICLSIGGWQDSNHSNLIYDTSCQSLIPWDTVVPTIDVNIVYNPGFVTNLDVNYSMRCIDNSTPITYQVIKNDTNYLYNSLDVNNSIKSGTITLLPASSTQFTFKCIDNIGNTSSYQTEQLYALLFRLVNEQTGANVSVSDVNDWLSSALVYTYDGNYSFDFNGSGVTTKTFLSPGTEVRFDFTYKNSTVIIGRDIDFSLITDQNIPICLAPPQTFYIQTIYSASTKPVILYLESTRCYNVISNTKFALENGLMARAYTIPKPYLLKTIINGITTTLTALDGSLENTINIDALQFNQSALDIKIGSDTISFGKDLDDYNIIKFYFQNPNDDSTSTNLTVRNGLTVLFSHTETSTPNEFVASWNYVDFNLDRNAILNMTVTKVVGGVSEDYTFYFTLNATYYQGLINEWFGLAVAFCLVLFGMTLVAYKYSFGWFGLLMLAAAFLIVSLAPGYWYIRFFQGILVILIIFVGIVFKNETQGAV